MLEHRRTTDLSTMDLDFLNSELYAMLALKTNRISDSPGKSAEGRRSPTSVLSVGKQSERISTRQTNRTG